MKQKNINKKAEFKNYFNAVIIFSMIIVATGVWVNSWNESYQSGLNYDLGGFNELSSSSSSASSQQSQITPQTADVGSDFEATSFRGAFGILANIYAPFRVVFGDGGMIDSITDRFGLPDYIRQGIITMMVISITFGLIAVIFRLTRTHA